MAKHVLNADRKKRWTINADNDIWTVNAGVTITVKRDTAISEDRSSRHDNLIKILGTLDVRTGNGLDLSGKNETVLVGSDGLIHLRGAGNAIAFGGSAWGGDIENHGTIHSEQFAISIFANSSDSKKPMTTMVLNDGTISSTLQAITNTMDDLAITNTSQGLIKGSTAIQMSHGDLTLVNKGTIIGTDPDGHAIAGGFDVDKVTNSGAIEGDINLGPGDDIFINKGGTVDGEITGEYGSDTYIVDSTSLKLFESDMVGADTVKSSVTWTLTDYFENLVLTGKGVIDATGNDAANELTGNDSANVITGLEGNDTMIGKGGADLFVFANESGEDTITDFDQGSDLIDLRSYAGIASFQDIASISQGADGAEITLSDGDTITLTGVAADDVNASDFSFAANG